MARISGVDLPREKRVEIGLTYIYGIGLSTSQKIFWQSISCNLWLFIPVKPFKYLFWFSYIQKITEEYCFGDMFLKHLWIPLIAPGPAMIKSLSFASENSL